MQVYSAFPNLKNDKITFTSDTIIKYHTHIFDTVGIHR